VFVLLAFLATALVSLWAISRYCRIREVSAYVLVPLFVAIYIPFSIVVLVPIDLMSSSQNSHPLFYINEAARLIIWRVMYWLAFTMTWAVLPILQSFVESGHHDPAKKLMDSLRSNAKYQAILLGSGLVGLLYVIITSGLSMGSIKALVIALSHCYALVIAIWLMGHGMVNLPRELWNSADPSARLANGYRQATKLCDAYAEAESSYADVASEILALAPLKDGLRYVEWIDELLDEVDSGPHFGRDGRLGRSRVTVERSMINPDYLSTLARRFIKAKARVIRHGSTWQKLLKDCSIAEDKVNARADRSLVFRYSRTRFPPKMAFLYYTYFHMYLIRMVAVVLCALSITLIWSELTHGTVVSVVNLIVSATQGIIQQLISSVFLGYMCICACLSLTRIRVFNVYALVHKGSDLSSMMFYATYICRLSVPLSYNYLTLISSRDSVFEEFLGKSINLTPLGKFVNNWQPRLILVPVFLTLFHFYDKVKQYLSLELAFDDDDDEFGQGSIIEGRELVNRALTDSRYRFAITPPDGQSIQLPPGGRIQRVNRDDRPPSAAAERRVFGGSPSRSPEPVPNVFHGVKSFFGNVRNHVQDRIENLRGDRSNLPRWARGRSAADGEDEPLTL
jgi:hypothetical protein